MRNSNADMDVASHGWTLGSLCEALRTAARTEKGISILNDDREVRLSYRDLLKDAIALASEMGVHGIERGDEVILQIVQPISFLRWFWACLIGGFVAVPIEVRQTPEHVAKVFRIWGKLKRKWLVSDPGAMNRLAEFGQRAGLQIEMKGMEEKTLPSSLAYAPGPDPVRNPDPDDRAFIQFSSGTTGDPKGVVLSHRNIATNILGIVERVGYSEGDRTLSWLPLTHDMGLIGFHLAPLVAGMDQFLMTPKAFLSSPGSWIKSLSEHRIQYTGCPNFGFRHFLKGFHAPSEAELDLSCVRLVFNGAEQISPALCADFMSALAPFGLRSGALYNVYGLAEASLAATMPPPDGEFRTVIIDRRTLEIGDPVRLARKDDPGALELAEVGTPLDGSPIRIAAKDGSDLGEGILGRILIKGENVTAGYYRGPLEVEPGCGLDGWLDTGDLGFMHQGRLVVTGRLKDVICANGRNLFCHDLESIASALPSIGNCRTAAVGVPGTEYQGEQVAFFLETKSRDWANLARAAAELKSHLLSSLSVEIAWVIPIPSLPKTTSGKIQRYKLKTEYLNGAFQDRVRLLAEAGFLGAGGQPAGQGTANEPLVIPGPDGVISRLLNAIAEALRVDPALIDPERSLLELGFDSLMASSLKNRAQEELGLALEISLFFEARPLKEILDTLSRMPMRFSTKAEPQSLEIEL